MNISSRTNKKIYQPQKPKRLSNIQFHPSIKSKTIDEIRSKHHSLLVSKEWRFNFEEYKKKSIKQILKSSEKILIESFSLHYFKNQFILKQLSCIQFPHLKSLYLNGNSINSLQALALANIPKLQRLYLSNNLITSARPLKKCCFRLKTLDLSQNKLLSYDSIWQGLDLSQLQDFLAYWNNKVILTFQFVKSQLVFPRIKKFFVSHDQGLHLTREKRLLKELGVQKVEVLNTPY